jgi:hypothetical protein
LEETWSVLSLKETSSEEGSVVAPRRLANGVGVQEAKQHARGAHGEDPQALPGR